MATRREIADEIRAQYGNFLSQSQVREYLGRGKDQTARFCEDIPYTQEGRKKRFMAIDIARKLDLLQQTVV